MHGLIRLSGLLILALAFIVPSFAGDEDKPVKKKGKGKAAAAVGQKGKSDDGDDKKGDKKGKEKDEKEKFTYNKNYWLAGKLTQMDPNSQRDFTLQVKIPELNPDTVKRLNQLSQQLLQNQRSFAQARDLNGRRNALNSINNTNLDILKAQATLYRFKDVDVKLRAAENMKVRWKDPPPDYDEKGNPKKYTKEEKKALMDPGLPFYRGEIDSLRTGQIVQVFLAKAHGYMKYNTKSKGKFKGIPKKAKKVDEDDDDPGIQDRPEVVVIVIHHEPQEK